MRICHKLILGFISVALLVAVVGYISVSASRKTLQESIGKSSTALAARILEHIDRGIYERIEIFQEYCRDSTTQRFVTESNKEFETLDSIQAYIDEKDRQWSSVPKAEITAFMQGLINNGLSNKLKKKIDFYEEKYGYPVFGEVFVTNKYGANAAQTGKTSDYRQDDEEWWQKAKRDGLYVADVEYDDSADLYSTDICIRIDDEAGSFLGVMKVVLNIEDIADVIKKAITAEEKEEKSTPDFKLLTKDHRVIYANEEYGPLQKLPIELSSVLHRNEREHGHTFYFIAAGNKPGEGEALFVCAHSKGYKNYKGLGWILVTEQETRDIFAPVAKLSNRILTMSAAIMALAIVIGLAISKSISESLGKVTVAATEIGEGKLNTPIEIKSNDEIGELASSFNNMACKLKESHTKLQKSYTQLEEKVKERTAELSSANVKLKGEVKKRAEAQEILEKRIKELNCLFGLSKLVEQPEITLEQMFQQTAELIRNAYRYPGLTCVRITFNRVHYKTDNFGKSELSQYSEIKLRGEIAGEIEVYYLGEKAGGDEGPFLKEERDLLGAVAEHLGRIAERTHTREKLQLFRNLIDRSNDCVFVMEPKWGRFLDVNERACGSLGYTREELLNMAVKDIDELIPDDSRWLEYVKQMKQKGSMTLEGLHRRRDGTVFPVDVNVSIIQKKWDSYVIAVARDITERKKAEEALRQSKGKLDAMLNSIADHMSMMDEELNIVWANETAKRIFGDDIIGRKCYEVYHRRHKPCEPYPCIALKAFEDGQIHEHDTQVIGEDGEVIDFHCTAYVALRNEEGKPTAVLEISRDITEHKKAEEKIQQAAEEWITTFNSITDLVSIHDKDFKLVKVNKALADAFGAEPEELIGKTCYEIIHGTKEPPAYCPHKQTIDTKKPQRAEFFEPRLGIYVEASTSPIFDENGEIIASIHIAKDITQRKKAEERQAQLLEEVEGINRELKDFAYVVSHDLKAPLRGIRTLADWMLTDYADKFNEEGKERMNQLIRRVERMHNLIEGVLTYSRVGRVREEQVRVNLNELVPDIINSIVPPENIAITIENELPIVKCEPTRIGQVFQNLLSNAIKYMDKPQGRINIGCAEEDGFWEFSVRDNGPGIEEKYFEKIFKMFQTLSPQDEFESTGVGLAVVKKIVVLYGGEIRLESKPGEGSTFFFTLPKQNLEVKNDAALEANIIG